MLDVADTSLLSFPGFFKAHPAEEAGERFVYLEASTEARDYQGEVVLARALEESAPYYLRYGNLDLDHKTQLGTKQGIANPYLFEIGRPVEVQCSKGRTFVKACVYSGDTPVANHANAYWDSVTKLTPPKRWYPSVGGAVLDKGPAFDPKTQSSHTVVRKVRWTNIGLSATPVNPTVPAVSTVPIGLLAKAWGADGIDLSKALEAGAGTDSAALSGGGAMRRQSLDRNLHSYWDFRDEAAKAIRGKRTPGRAGDLVEYAHREHGLSKAQGAEWAERFHRDLQSALSARGRAAQPQKGTIQ